MNQNTNFLKEYKTDCQHYGHDYIQEKITFDNLGNYEATEEKIIKCSANKDSLVTSCKNCKKYIESKRRWSDE